MSYDWYSWQDAAMILRYISHNGKLLIVKISSNATLNKIVILLINHYYPQNLRRE